MTDQNPAPQREPLPGEQYPAAELPGDPTAAQPPSGPFPAQPSDPFAEQPPPSDPFAAQAPPAAGDPFPPPGPPPHVPAPPRKPRNQPAIVLAIVAVLFIAATGVLGTLFIVEQGDHKRTSAELGTARAELDDAKKSAAHAADELKRKNERMDEMQACVSAAAKFLDARTDQEAEKLFDEMFDDC